MSKYIIAFIIYTLQCFGEPDYYKEVYEIEAKDIDELTKIINEILVRKVAIKYNVSLDRIELLLVVKIKD